jgi:hypothetical protein
MLRMHIQNSIEAPYNEEYKRKTPLIAYRMHFGGLEDINIYLLDPIYTTREIF